MPPLNILKTMYIKVKLVKPNIQDSWNSVERTIDYYGDHQDVIIANAGPGHWNDPDMVSGALYLVYIVLTLLT